MPDDAPQGTEGTSDAQAAAEKPPWGDDFDAEKAWKLVQNLKDENKKIKTRPVLTDEAKAKLDQFEAIEAASKSDLEKANEALTRWQSESEKWRTAAVSSKIQAHAAADFADPSDAVSALDPSKYLDSGGVIDERAIQADLAGLLEAKPHYRKAPDTTPRVPAPNAAQGTGGKAAPTEPGAIFAAELGRALQRR